MVVEAKQILCGASFTEVCQVFFRLKIYPEDYPKPENTKNILQFSI